ncbi:crotonobetainyl-CoA--carnitine CoA-transferase [Citrobacter freundii]|nr:crotonobetainyl-CoA--carnitine CoA-transferase [Citrobacter freundii]
MTEKPIRTLIGSTSSEVDHEINLAKQLRASRIPNNELLNNIGLYITRQTLSRINFMQDLYKKIVPVHGVIMEFGVRWGQNMALFSTLRGIHEPFNYNRKIIGFDTFEGFPSVTSEDGSNANIGDYGVVDNWITDLDEVLNFHNQNAPIPRKKKYELVTGDATVSLPNYLDTHPETIIALAYFDFDLYKPTRDCLEAILPHLTKGSVIAFDELNMPEFPGETIALREVLGLSRYAIRRDPINPLTSYVVIE